MDGKKLNIKLDENVPSASFDKNLVNKTTRPI